MNFNLLRVFDHGGATRFDFSSRSIIIKDPIGHGLAVAFPPTMTSRSGAIEIRPMKKPPLPEPTNMRAQSHRETKERGAGGPVLSVRWM